MIHTFLAAALSLFNYVNVPVADLHDEPSRESKVTSQAYLSEPVHIIEEDGGWAKVESALDGYEGWIQKNDIFQSNAPFLSDSLAPIVKINSFSANLYSIPDATSQTLMVLPFESCLETLGTCDPLWIKVALPDGREAYIQHADVVLEPSHATVDELCALSQKFVGQPSLTAGRSSFGYGSSEFVQMLYREMGISLPRDLQGQFKWEGFDAVSLDILSPGDLVYFGNDRDTMVSAGIYLGDDQLIHADISGKNPGICIEQLSCLTRSFQFADGRTLKGQGSSKYKFVQTSSEMPITKPILSIPPSNFTLGNPKNQLRIDTPFEHIQNVEEYDSIPVEAIDSITDTNTKVHDQRFAYYFVNEQKLPLVISPNESDASEVTLNDFQAWAQNHRSELQSQVSTHGAILLRGFPVKDSNDFVSVLKSVLGSDPMDYSGGEGSRTKIIDGVYTSTEAPPQFQIPLHNDLSCTNDPPTYINFFCETAPEPGTGHTILGSTERVTQAVMKDPDLWNLFNGKTLRYISRHPPDGNFFTKVNNTHRTWQQSFETNDRQEVERICKEKGFEFQWQGDWIEVTRKVTAIKGPDGFFDHPYWFNQAHLYHANPRIRGGMVNHILANTLYIVPSTRQYDIFFEDGSSIPRNAMYKVYDIMEQETVKFDWNKGDVLIVHNIKSLHGRSPYQGKRRILVSFVP